LVRGRGVLSPSRRGLVGVYRGTTLSTSWSRPRTGRICPAGSAGSRSASPVPWTVPSAAGERCGPTGSTPGRSRRLAQSVTRSFTCWPIERSTPRGGRTRRVLLGALVHGLAW